MNHTRSIFSHGLSLFDLLIVLFFIALFLILPKFFNRTSRSSDQDFLLMSNGLTLPLFIATLTSTWYGGIFGVTQIAFEQGFYSFFSQGLFWYLSYAIFAIFLAKRIRAHRVLSLPELIGSRFGDKARALSGFILFLHALPVTYAISVGLLIHLSFGLDIFWAQVIGVSVVAIYTSIGGFRGVVLTDFLQFILMFAAVILLLIFAIDRFGFSFLIENLPPAHFTWRGERDSTSAIVWFFIAMTTTLIHPVFYQRCLAAKSDSVARRGIFFAMLLWLIFDICTTLGGMYARAILPTASSATAYLELGLDILPVGIRGLFVSGILATILSTLDSFLFVSGMSISYDVFFKKSVDHRNFHRMAILACGFLVIAVSTSFHYRFEPIWLFLEGAFGTSMLTPVLATLFIKGPLPSKSFFMSVLSAQILFLVATTLKEGGMSAIEPFYVGHVTAFLTFGLSYIGNNLWLKRWPAYQR